MIYFGINVTQVSTARAQPSTAWASARVDLLQVSLCRPTRLALASIYEIEVTLFYQQILSRNAEY